MDNFDSSASKNGRAVSTRPVTPLPLSVARKIAAGEVIDRPASILRELLDNAVDSGADTVTAEISGGGIDEISVSDNGIGMTKDDLAACAHPHCTSKIITEDDLRNLSTLGFRGEALASIAAVSRMEIISRRTGSNVAWKLAAPLAGDGENTLSPAVRTEGTTVKSQALFEAIPARRHFLKRPATETAQCRQLFIEKALPFTNITFKLIADGKIRLDLPAGETLAERFTEAFELSEPAELFSEVHLQDRNLFSDATQSPATTAGSASDTAVNSDTAGSIDFGDWRITLLLGDPSVSRTDKRHILIYVNGRRVQEYSLLQAIEYGATGFFPNGTHPAAVLFLEMNPALVDFNIHPAKREVRFKDIAAVHHAVSTAVRNFYLKQSVERRDAEQQPELPVSSIVEKLLPREAPAGSAFIAPHTAGAASSYTSARPAPGKAEAFAADTSSGGSSYRSTYPENCDFASCGSDISARYATPKAESAFCKDTQPVTADFTTDTEEDDFRYIGQLLQVFLIIEKNDAVFLIDQHAGHERLLYDRFMQNAGKKQPLLFPDSFETDSAQDDEYIEDLVPALEQAGFSIRQAEAGIWEITAVPATWTGSALNLKQALLEERIRPDEIQRTLAAYTACRSAVKEGHFLDAATAKALARDILALKDPHCPHGRPLWIQLTRADLYALIKRT